MRRYRRTSALILGLVACLGGCAKPEVSGNVLPAEAERTGLPWLRVEVRLLRGALMDELATRAAKHREEAASEVIARVLADAKSVQTARGDAPARAGDANDPATSVRACLADAEAAVVNAKGNQRTALRDLMPRLAAAGVTATQPDAVIDQLQRAAKAKVASEARRLRDEYLSTQLVQQSGTVLAAGTRLDRLCWNAHNKNDVAVRFRGLTVLFNERELPRVIAEQLWRLPPPDKPLAMPGARGVNKDLLMPGEHYEACFYASRRSISVDVLHRFGLSTENPNRNGDWRVRWENIELVDPAAASGRVDLIAARAADPIADAFPDRLRQFESQLDERQLIGALQGSSSARALAQAEGALVACHRAIETDKVARELERVIRAIEEGRSDDRAVQARVQPILQKTLREPARIAKWVTEAKAFLEQATVARQQQDFGAAYHFEDLEPGRYTLLASPALETPQPKVWLIALEVQGPLTQDLVAAAARDIPFQQTLENVLLGG